MKNKCSRNHNCINVNKNNCHKLAENIKLHNTL